MPKHRVSVAFCIDSFEIGGTELNAVRTMEALDHSRFELSVVHLQDKGPLRLRYEKLGLRMIHLPISNLYSIGTAKQGLRLAKILRNWQIDVLHAHDIYTNIFAVPWARLLTGCSVIASRRWWRKAPRPGLAKLNRWNYLFAHRVLANSSSVKGLLASYEGVAPDKIVEIPNFLAGSAFELVDKALRIAQRRAWGVPDDAFVIGTVARLAPVKNHALLLTAAAQLDLRFHLVFVGDGPLRDELEGFSRQLGIKSRVHFAGEVVSRINLNQFFDVSVLCSLSEGSPNSLIEAFAAGIPVVATPVGGVTDVVKESVTGFLVPPDGPTQLADALRRLEADRKLRARLGESGREMVKKKHNQGIVIEKLSSLYETLAERRMINC
jgi:glycosyltransferase involved in cell wall biosynthesis